MVPDIVPRSMSAHPYFFRRCESHLCSIIVAPANTWSNLAFIFFGAQMIKRSHNLNSRTLSMFGPASIMTGVTSLLYHASYTWFFQVFDFVGMFCFLFVIISLNSRRLGWILPQYVHKFAGMSQQQVFQPCPINIIFNCVGILKQHDLECRAFLYFQQRCPCFL